MHQIPLLHSSPHDLVEPILEHVDQEVELLGVGNEGDVVVEFGCGLAHRLDELVAFEASEAVGFLSSASQAFEVGRAGEAAPSVVAIEFFAEIPVLAGGAESPIGACFALCGASHTGESRAQVEPIHTLGAADRCP